VPFQSFYVKGLKMFVLVIKHTIFAQIFEKE